jgi:hypothetical protein
MFDKKYEERLAAWVDFRNQLETSNTPLDDILDFYNRAPLVKIQVDPYDQSSWLDPWMLLYENKYCDFSILLGIFYTLALTTRFSDSKFEIHICTNKNKSEIKYLLFVDNNVIGYAPNRVLLKNDLPATLLIEKTYELDIAQ